MVFRSLQDLVRRFRTFWAVATSGSTETDVSEERPARSETSFLSTSSDQIPEFPRGQFVFVKGSLSAAASRISSARCRRQVYAQTLEQAALGAYSPGGTARAVRNVVRSREAMVQDRPCDFPETRRSEACSRRCPSRSGSAMVI